MKITSDIFTSHALARALGALLVLYLYVYDEKLLAEYSVKFSTLHIAALILKFGFAQKIFRDSSANLKSGIVTLRKYNTLFCFLFVFVLLTNFVFLSFIVWLTVMIIAFSSVRFAYLMGCGKVKTSILFEFTVPVIITFTLIFFRIIETIEYILFIAYIPSFFAAFFLLRKSEYVGIERLTIKDLQSGMYFFLSSLTQQLNSHIVILLFNANFTYEYVSNIRLVQVFATPMQLVNVSFATAFQKLAKGEYRYVDVNYENRYLMVGFLVSMTVLSFVLFSQYLNLYVDANYELIKPFFISFLALYLIRIIFKFSDTRIIIAKREDLIFKFNFIITIIICIFGLYFSLAGLPLAAYICFNLAPLLLAICCYIRTNFYDARL
jgi:O-antigen/teichoic acid export membrane protein